MARPAGAPATARGNKAEAIQSVMETCDVEVTDDNPKNSLFHERRLLAVIVTDLLILSSFLRSGR